MSNNIQPNSQPQPDFATVHRGLFTGSEIHNLITPTLKIADNDTSRGYILRKAIEKKFGYVHDVFAKAMEHGTEFQPLAFNKFNEVYGAQFITAAETGFLSIDENSGATPDGIVSDGAILEIKCPYDALNFFKLVQSGEVKKEYALQVQMEMMAAKVNKAYFFNYCVINGIEYYHTIIIEKDTAVQAVITEAIAQAVIKRDEMIYDLMGKLTLTADQLAELAPFEAVSITQGA